MADLTIDAQVANAIAQVCAPVHPYTGPTAEQVASWDRAFGREPTTAEAIADQVVRVWIYEQRVAIARAEWHLEQNAAKRGKVIREPDHYPDMIESWEGLLHEARRELRELQGPNNAPRASTGD